MKKTLKHISSCLIMMIVMAHTSCKVDELEKIESAIPPLIYLSQLEDGAINIKTENVIVDKTNKTMLLIMGVHRSGVQSREAFSVDFQLDNSKIPAGTTAFKPSDYTLSLSKTANVPVTKIDVPAWASSVPLYLTIPKSVFDANQGKKLAMHIKISNPTKHALNTELSEADIIFEPGSFPYVTNDITEKYIKNPGGTPPFARADNDGTRFGILKDWLISSSVKNQDANTHGGFDSYQGGAAMSMEKWGSNPNIANGKIYQTFTLPAGKYEFQIDFSTATVNDQAWIVAAAGSTLPDVANIPASTLGATKLLSNSGVQSVKASFDLSTAQQVSLGIVANFVNGNNAFRANSVKFIQLKNPFE